MNLTYSRSKIVHQKSQPRAAIIKPGDIYQRDANTDQKLRKREVLMKYYAPCLTITFAQSS